MVDTPGPDLRALMIPMRPAKIGHEGYSHVDRYHDFRAVFFGNATEAQRERVLFQILAECGVHSTIASTQDPNRTFMDLGRREIGLWLMQVLTTEPPQAMPTRVQSED